MHTLSVAFGIFTTLLFLYIAGRVGWEYYKAKELKGWERLRAAAWNSATMIFNELVGMVAGLLGGLSQISDLLGAPEVAQWFNSHIADAKLLSSIMLAIYVGIFMTRMRTLVPKKTE
jgi:hypothetical protein